MFGSRRNQPVTQASANTAVNKILTYGLIGFLIFAMYTSREDRKRNELPPTTNINYTPIELGNYIRIKNYATGEQGFYNLDKMEPFRLSLTHEEIKSLKTRPGEHTALFEIEIVTSKTANVFEKKQSQK